MKRASILLLCTIFLFNCAGWQCIFFYIQNELHELNWGGKTYECLVVIEAAECVDLINPHEITVHGKLYDIITVEKTPSGTRYVCKQDEKEEALFSTLSFNSSQQSKDKANGGRLISVKTYFDFLIPAKIFIEPAAKDLQTAANDVMRIGKPVITPPFSPPEA